MSIQRYNAIMASTHNEGAWVTYADHIAAVAATYEKGRHHGWALRPHYPECPATNCGCEQGEECGPTCIHTCICSALRACEARVREETQQEFRGFAEAAWAKALAAAWLAVDNTRTGFLMAIGASPEPPERYWIPKDDALDAIDALRESNE